MAKYDVLREEKEFLEEIKYLTNFDIKYECQYAMAFGCQAKATGYCDKGESCFDI